MRRREAEIESMSRDREKTRVQSESLMQVSSELFLSEGKHVWTLSNATQLLKEKCPHSNETQIRNRIISLWKLNPLRLIADEFGSTSSRAPFCFGLDWPSNECLRHFDARVEYSALDGQIVGQMHQVFGAFAIDLEFCEDASPIGANYHYNGELFLESKWSEGNPIMVTEFAEGAYTTRCEIEKQSSPRKPIYEQKWEIKTNENWFDFSVQLTTTGVVNVRTIVSKRHNRVNGKLGAERISPKVLRDDSWWSFCWQTSGLRVSGQATIPVSLSGNTAKSFPIAIPNSIQELEKEKPNYPREQ